MATLELSPLSEHLEADQIKALKKALAEAGAGTLGADDHGETSILDRNIDDDVLKDFMDRLDANDAAADVYLPLDFEDVIEVDGLKVGSTHALALVLDSLKEDFFVEDEDDDEDEEADDEGGDEDEEDEDDEYEADDEEDEVKDVRLQHIWKVLAKGTKTATKRGLCLFVRA
jgi:hypothetical protein